MDRVTEYIPSLRKQTLLQFAREICVNLWREQLINFAEAKATWDKDHYLGGKVYFLVKKHSGQPPVVYSLR